MSLIRPILLGLVVLLGAHTGAGAQIDLSEAVFEDLLRTWEQSLANIDTDLARPDITDREIDPLREQAQLVKRWAVRIREQAVLDAEQQSRLLRALGPPPQVEEAEDPGVFRKRRELTEKAARYEGRIKKINVIVARADSLMTQMTRAEFTFVANILEQRTQSPLLPSVIANGLSLLPERFATIRDAAGTWWRETDFADRWASSVGWIAVFIAIMIGAFFPLRAWLLDHCGPSRGSTRPTLARRLLAIVAQTVANVILPVALVVAAYTIILQSAGFTAELKRILNAFTFSAIQFLVVVGISAAALSPTLPAWRISHFTDKAALKLHRAIRLWAGTAVVVNLFMVLTNPVSEDTAVMRIIRLDATSNDLAAITTMSALLIMGLAVWNVLRGRNWRFVRAEGEESGAVEVPAGGSIRWLFGFARVALLVGIVLGVLGYVNLGLYINGRIVGSLLVIGLAVLIRALLAEILGQLGSAETRIGALLQSRFDLRAATMQRLTYWLTLLIDVGLVITAGALLLLAWGVTGGDLSAIFFDLVQGVAVGSFRVSLTDIGIAIGVFLLLLLGIRLVQRFLATRVLNESVVDVGVRDALTAVFGYIGIVVALLISVSLLGLELSQLAIIFGALSVGIGFGLQNLVNNFVSGLILLMQRPIKAGDWIVIGANEGYVKKVSVTSTEIQTFDNASLIVPNSQLVSNEVLNWMHKSNLGRVVLPVGVSYSSDPQQVQDLLLKCVADNPKVLQRPAPDVLFRNFGDSALLFELRFFLRDIDQRLTVSSGLRFAIKKAFDEAGIEIPFPQRDLHVKNVDPGLLNRDGNTA